MTQIFALHSGYGLATAAAAIDSGLLDAPSSVSAGERLLVPFTSSRVPETVVGIAEDPGLRSLRARFDRIEPLADLLGPLHPSSWNRPMPTSPCWSGCSLAPRTSTPVTSSCSCRARRSRRPAP